MLQNVLELVVTLIIFVLVLFAAFYSSRWIAKKGGSVMQTANIKVIETFKIAPNKYIQIIQLGTKYYSIGITKDHITYLAELEEEQLDFSKQSSVESELHFKDILKNLTHNENKKK